MLGESIKSLVKSLLPFLVKWFGSNIHDTRTGQMLGKAILLPWRGGVRLIGLPNAFIAARFAPAPQTFYWHQNLEFFTHPPVDYPRLAPSQNRETGLRSRILWVILGHQNAKTIDQILSYWSAFVPREDILFLYGGKSRAEFELISHPQKLFISDSRLHTTAHILQKQSYTKALQEAASWTRDREIYSHIYFAESDLFPIRKDVTELLLSQISETKADILFYSLTRVDGTNWCHLLYHQSDPGFASFFPSISVREEKGTILNAIGCGSFWTRESFEAVTKLKETEPIFLELFLPTVAHHLGYRVIELTEQSQFIDIFPKNKKDLHDARSLGAWFVHPVKDPTLLLTVP
jgi:hypothetical protein